MTKIPKRKLIGATVSAESPISVLTYHYLGETEYDVMVDNEIAVSRVPVQNLNSVLMRIAEEQAIPPYPEKRPELNFGQAFVLRDEVVATVDIAFAFIRGELNQPDLMMPEHL